MKKMYLLMSCLLLFVSFAKAEDNIVLELPAYLGIEQCNLDSGLCMRTVPTYPSPTAQITLSLVESDLGYKIWQEFWQTSKKENDIEFVGSLNVKIHQYTSNTGETFERYSIIASVGPNLSVHQPFSEITFWLNSIAELPSSSLRGEPVEYNGYQYTPILDLLRLNGEPIAPVVPTPITPGSFDSDAYRKMRNRQCLVMDKNCPGWPFKNRDEQK